MKYSLSGLVLSELETLVEDFGQPRYRAKQLFSQIHRRLAADFGPMTDLPKEFRAALADKKFTIDSLELVETLTATDGTTKYILKTHDRAYIESVLIPMDKGRYTHCISSQLGCALACTFCLTGRMGLRRNLSTAEIVDQVRLILRISREKQIRNYVFMGMGEPLLNFENVKKAIEIFSNPLGMGVSPRRITVSTVGIPEKLEKLGKETRVQVAISLNAPEQGLRAALMPASKRWPLEQVLHALRRYPLPARRRITIEYVLLAGINDTPEHAESLARLLRGIPSKVNIIPFNPFPGARFERPPDSVINHFVRILASHWLTVTIRESKGAEIFAACGQLAYQSNK